MDDRFDNEESTGFVSNIPQEVVEAMPYGPGMVVKAIFQKVWDYLNREPELQKEFARALRLMAAQRRPPALKKRVDQDDFFKTMAPYLGLKYEHPVELIRADQPYLISLPRPFKEISIGCHEMDVKVEDAEEPSKEMGWFFREQRGWEVKVPCEGFDQKIMECVDDEEKLALISSCADLVELDHDQKVLVMGITGWIRGRVVATGFEYFGEPYVDTGGSVFPLYRADDERFCWVTTTQITKRCFDMIKED
jgi:hypothetical protein